MTQLEALKIAYDELSSMMPDEDNSEIFEAADIIEKMIHTKENQNYKRELKNTPISKADKKRSKEINDLFADLLNDL